MPSEGMRVKSAQAELDLKVNTINALKPLGLSITGTVSQAKKKDTS